MVIKIQYKVTKGLGGGFAPTVYVNGQWQYTTERNAKSIRGAMSKCKRMAERIAKNYRGFNNEIIIEEIK